MKTPLTKYDLYCYWNCTKGYTILITGTINQISQYITKHRLKTMASVRQQYGRSAYTVLYRRIAYV